MVVDRGEHGFYTHLGGLRFWDRAIAEAQYFGGFAKFVISCATHKHSFIVVLTGILSNIGVDSGYVVLIPLAGVLFHAAGRHPVVGIVACFAGVSAGFSANFLIGPFDAIMSGITQNAAQLMLYLLAYAR